MIKRPLTIEVDKEVFAHLLLLQVKRGGSLSDQIEYLLTRADDQFTLPLEGKKHGQISKTNQ